MDQGHVPEGNGPRGQAGRAEIAQEKHKQQALGQHSPGEPERRFQPVPQRKSLSAAGREMRKSSANPNHDSPRGSLTLHMKVKQVVSWGK